MTTQIDFRTLPANVPVLCIPRVYPNISESRIRGIFDELGMGTLDHIDIVPKTSDKGEKFNRVFVHFRRWNDSENANTARERLLNGKEIKIIYDDPWFWKISAFKESERKSAPQQHTSSVSSKKATIAFDFDDERTSRPAYRDDRRDFRRDDRRDVRRDDHYRDDRRDIRRDDRRDIRRDDRRDVRRDDRRRDNSRERPRKAKPEEKPVVQEQPVRKFIEERTPSNSPEREQRAKDYAALKETHTVEYGNIMPPFKKRGVKKAEQKLVIETEAGELNEQEEKKTETA